ncbi:YhgE/Pip domain-containing protein [Jeotgalibacillus haloalkalitolerans]|uniref:YhgE/Pip domain-containing protein n=1 Tax=Jeotgalibacillus haloalkalitolerans TaxID=3104292 RepID=A0ABU5KNH7_9BACL|nr:YhgE/Pip domain-containing protein [Jeotgalibacillus sp. HH7-29]MDZ5712812.1 YhgE/Pip domain-containing protein [Jeotgalibacillus sp. HH7-29]
MKFKRTSAGFAAFLLTMPTLLVSAETQNTVEDNEQAGEGAFDKKTEVVYATLDAAGEQKDLYVVNNFTVSEFGEITDYGDYTSIQNLTDLTPIEQQEREITLNAQEEEFYYQGNLENRALPWDFDISYTLNGEAADADSLIGQDGELNIQIDSSKNADGEALFFNNYMLQITLTLDADRFKNIEAPDGTIATAGKNRQVTFTVLPEKDESYQVSAEVTDLEMEAIEIAAVPSSMSIDAPDTAEVKKEMTSLSDATAEVNNGVGELQSGIAELNDGTASLYDGSAQFRDGISQLSQNAGGLNEGSASIQQAINQMSESVGAGIDDVDTSQFSELPGAFRQIAGGLEEVESGMTDLSGSYEQAYHAFDQAIAAVPEHQVSEEEIAALYESGADEATINKLVESYQSSLAVKETYRQTQEAFAAVPGALSGSTGALREMSSQLYSIADQLENGLAATNMDESLGQLQQGLATLASNYSEFHSGLTEYTGGVSDLAGSYGELHSGIGGLTGGTEKLETGAGALYSGTSELASATSELPDQLQEEIDAMLSEFDKSDFEPVSFVSDQNEDVESVQFVIKTDSLKKEDADETEEEAEEEKSFWDRLVDLFK